MSAKIKSATISAMLDQVADEFVAAVELKKSTLAKEAGMPPPEAPMAAPKEAPPAAPAPEAPTDDPEAIRAELSKLSPEQLEAHIQIAMELKQAMGGEAPPAALEADAANAAPPPEMDKALDLEEVDADAGEISVESLQAEYAKLSPEELKMHQDALQAALAPAEEASAPAEKSPEKSAPAAEKSPEIEKAMAELQELKLLVKNQSEEIANLHNGIKQAVERPLRKSVSSVYTAPSAAKSHSVPDSLEAVDAKLTELSKSGKLSKDDRQLVNTYWLTKTKPNLEKLAHLFEEKII